MSRFRSSVRRLTKHVDMPVFALMRRLDKPLPISAATGKRAIDSAALGSRRTVRMCLHRLFWSRSYLEACAADGAMVYGADGRPHIAVSAEGRAWALRRLGEKASDVPHQQPPRSPGVEGKEPGHIGIAASG